MFRVLLVEDNQDSREGLARRLQRRGYEVVQACDGQQGLALARSARPDLVLMDMNLPLIDGWEATRQLKTAAETRELPIIALTAHSLSSDRIKTLGAGCSDYHTKPVDLSRLLGQIEALLKDRQPNSAGVSARPLPA
jgi:two-component system, cell cycle response regulator DivK